jgi:hypothetical protein
MMNYARALDFLKEIEFLTEDSVVFREDDYIKEAISQDLDVAAAFEIIRMDLRARMPRCA